MFFFRIKTFQASWRGARGGPSQPQEDCLSQEEQEQELCWPGSLWRATLKASW